MDHESECQHANCSLAGVYKSSTVLQSQRPGGPRIIPFLDKRSFDFSNIDSGFTSSMQMSVVLCAAVCVLDYHRVRLSVRVHSISMPSSGQAIRFLVYGTLPSDDDPGRDFVDGNTFLSVDLTQSTIAPTLVTATATDPDAYLRIVLVAVQAPVAASLTAELSAALILRDF